MSQNTEQFTDEEKRVIGSYLYRLKPSRFDMVFDYGIYLLPSFLFAIYGWVNSDVVAILVAYIVLLVAALLYLGSVRRSSQPFYSAIQKYEAQVGALGNPVSTAQSNPPVERDAK